MWSNDSSSQRSMLGFSPLPIFGVYLPLSDDSFQLSISIRDSRGCRTDWNLSSLIVTAETNTFADLRSSTDRSTLANSFVHLLFSRNQNRVGQMITSLSRQLNQKSMSSSHLIFLYLLSPLVSCF